MALFVICNQYKTENFKKKEKKNSINEGNQNWY